MKQKVRNKHSLINQGNHTIAEHAVNGKLTTNEEINER